MGHRPVERNDEPLMMTKRYFRLELLDGQHVRKLVGREMALDDYGPQWTHPTVPCLQLDALFFCLDNGKTVKLYGFHSDDGGAEFALEECEPPEIYQGEPEDFFRTRVLDELAIGPFRSIRTEGETGVELWRIQVGESEIVLVAAEVEAYKDGYLFRRPDESILLFSPPNRVEMVEWNRYRNLPNMPIEIPGAQEIELERKLGGWPSARTEL